MVAAELNQRQHLVAAGGAVIGATLAAGLVAVLDPQIAGSTPPHPTLTGSLYDWVVEAASTTGSASPSRTFAFWRRRLCSGYSARRRADSAAKPVTSSLWR